MQKCNQSITAYKSAVTLMITVMSRIIRHVHEDLDIAPSENKRANIQQNGIHG